MELLLAVSVSSLHSTASSISQILQFRDTKLQSSVDDRRKHRNSDVLKLKHKDVDEKGLHYQTISRILKDFF